MKTLEEKASDIAHVLSNRLAIRYFLNVDSERGHYFHMRLLYAEMGGSPKHNRLVEVSANIFHSSTVRPGIIKVQRPNGTTYGVLETQVASLLQEWIARLGPKYGPWLEAEPFVGIMSANGDEYPSTGGHEPFWLLYTGVLLERLERYRVALKQAQEYRLTEDDWIPISLEHIERIMTRFNGFTTRSLDVMLEGH